MGHTRLGTLPDTAPWRKVVGLIADGEGAAAVAAATTEAAAAGLRLARNDEGLAYCFWLLGRLAEAGRYEDHAAALHEAGLPVTGELTAYEIAGCFSDAVDRHLRCLADRSDVAEMAQMAAVEALTAQMTARAAGLYGSGPVEARRAAGELATDRGFATLAHDFFARFTQRFLGYHLGRELPRHVAGSGRFAGTDDHAAFVEQLAVHCREVAGVLREFARGWYRKALRESDLSIERARKFTRKAMGKVRAELKLRGARDGH